MFFPIERCHRPRFRGDKWGHAVGCPHSTYSRRVGSALRHRVRRYDRRVSRAAFARELLEA